MPEGIEKVFGAIAGGSGAVNILEADRAPTVNDDAGDGFNTGSVWFKKSTGNWWTCSDATVGAAVWNELSSGGGDILSENLVLDYKDAGSNYSLDEDEWVDASGGPTLAHQAGGWNATSPPSAITSNRVAFGNFAGIRPPQAVLDAINVDDLTLIFGCRLPTDAGKIFLLAGGYKLQVRFHNQASTGNFASINRGGGTIQAATSGGDTSALTVITSTFARGGKVTVQVNSDTPVVSASDSGDSAINLTADAGDGFPYAEGATGNAEVGFIRAYSEICSAEKIAALLTEVTDNADYGMAGYDPS
jgi:hypothetical protein